jgi:hypothetical protein
MELCHGLLIPHSSVPHAPLFPLCSLQTLLEYACLTDHVAFSTEPHHLQHESVPILKDGTRFGPKVGTWIVVVTVRLGFVCYFLDFLNHLAHCM